MLVWLGVQLMGAGPRAPVDAEERINAIAAEVIQRIRRDHPNGEIDPDLIREVGLCLPCCLRTAHSLRLLTPCCQA